MMSSGKLAKPVSYLKVRFKKDQETFVILQIIAQSKAAYFSGNSKFVKKAFSDIRKTIKETKVDQ